MRGDHRVRERSDHERDIRKTNKQTNKAFIFNFKCDGKPLEGLSKGVTLPILNFNKNLLTAVFRKNKRHKSRN